MVCTRGIRPMLYWDTVLYGTVDWICQCLELECGRICSCMTLTGSIKRRNHASWRDSDWLVELKWVVCTVSYFNLYLGIEMWRLSKWWQKYSYWHFSFCGCVRVWVQINRSPSFGTDEKLDFDIKSALIEDTFRLLNIKWVLVQGHARVVVVFVLYLNTAEEAVPFWS